MANESDKTPHLLDIALGKRIRRRRKELGLSQSDLANEIGLTFQQIQKYENGINRVSFSKLIGIANALNITAESFCDGLQQKKGLETVMFNAE